jgi:hypothetical protein
MSLFAAISDEHLKLLASLGIKLDPGVSLDDVARNPEKYAKSQQRPVVKVDKTQLEATLKKLKEQAIMAKRDLATGKTAASVELAGNVGPFFNILSMDPEEFADPVDLVVQKHNFAVYCRKFSLYTGYLYTVNKKTHEALREIADRYGKTTLQAEKTRDAELEKLAKQYGLTSTQRALLKHKIHVQYFNTCNGAGESAFGSSTKRGCSLSGKVTDSVMPKDAKSGDIDKSPWENVKDNEGFGEPFAGAPPTSQFHKKETWSGKFVFNKKKKE